MKYIGSLVRTALAALSGFLLSIGVDADVVHQFTQSSETVALALITYALVQVWSMSEKTKK